MKIEIIKEINSHNITWYRVYANNICYMSFDTEKGARNYIQQFKDKKFESKEIIYSEIINKKIS